MTGFALPDGRHIPIEPRNFGVGGPPGALRGDWIFVYNIGTSVCFDRSSFNTGLKATSNGNGGVTDGKTSVGFEYQVSGAFAGKVVGFRWSSTGATTDQYVYDLQLEEGRGSWVSPTTTGIRHERLQDAHGYGHGERVRSMTGILRFSRKSARATKGVSISELGRTRP